MLEVHLAMLVQALTVLVIDGYLYIIIYPIKTHFSGQSLGVASSANTHVYNADSVMDINRASYTGSPVTFNDNLAHGRFDVWNQ